MEDLGEADDSDPEADFEAPLDEGGNADEEGGRIEDDELGSLLLSGFEATLETGSAEDDEGAILPAGAILEATEALGIEFDAEEGVVSKLILRETGLRRRWNHTSSYQS